MRHAVPAIMFSLALAVYAASARADRFLCDPTITIEAAEERHATQVCTAVQRAIQVIDACGLPQIPGALTIQVVDELEQPCMAHYQCAENEIYVLSPEIMEANRVSGAFSHLGAEAYFSSVIVHEVAHSVAASLPCPFESCIVAEEYVAYALQVMSLTPPERTEFEKQASIDGRVSSEDLSPVYLFMAPDRFAQKVWSHLQDRDDPCLYLQSLVKGQLLLDRERF